MTREVTGSLGSDQVSRRDLMKRIGAVAAAAATLAPRIAAGQNAPARPATPPSTVTNPPRDFSPGAPPVTYPDPDVLTIDPMFNSYRLGNTALVRLWTGALWAEGPAWSSQGRYLVWSDIPNNRQLRWLEDNGQVTVFRMPSNNSNGNTFDFQGRQLSCEHLTRRVVRYEHDGTVTIIADAYQTKHFNSPNDIVAHPDGSIWFTDPPFGDQLYEGGSDAPGGPGNQTGHLRSRVGQPAEAGVFKRESPTNVYRVDPSGRVDVAIAETDLPAPPNGLAFPPDYKKLYVVSQGNLYAFDVGTNNKPANRKLFTDFMVDGVKCGTDGVRVDVDGNLWCASNAGRNLGYSGVTVWTPEGKLIGRIRLPEACANLTFGGPKRNRLFMTASQSLYAVYLATQGAAPA